jgi:hypothetical protein
LFSGFYNYFIKKLILVILDDISKKLNTCILVLEFDRVLDLKYKMDEQQIIDATANLEVSDSMLKSKMQNMIEKNLNYTKWKIYLKLFRIICKNNGIIFGGATRDYVKRGIAAKKFATFCKDNKLNFKEHYMNSVSDPDTYQDRKLLPIDIDVYINEKDFNSLRANIACHYMHYEVKQYNPSYLFTSNDVLKEAINHFVYEIDFLGKHGNMFLKTIFDIDSLESYPFRIKIDYIVLKDGFTKHRESYMGRYLSPPFGNPDFDVNQLHMQYTLLDGFSIKVSNSLINSMINEHVFNPMDRDDIIQKLKEKIFKNIENNVAVPIMPIFETFYKVLPNCKPRVNLGRLQKMVDKGYDVSIIDTVTYDNTYTKAPEDFEYDEEDKCIICFDAFSSEKPWYQMGCKCNVKMHLLCMSKYVRNPSMNDDHHMTCPHCRTYFKQCHCHMINFINSLKHKGEVLEGRTRCRDCNFNTDIICTAWYKTCPCCNNNYDS